VKEADESRSIAKQGNTTKQLKWNVPNLGNTSLTSEPGAYLHQRTPQKFSDGHRYGFLGLQPYDPDPNTY
jgi:hypothetical protein